MELLDDFTDEEDSGVLLEEVSGVLLEAEFGASLEDDSVPLLEEDSEASLEDEAFSDEDLEYRVSSLRVGIMFAMFIEITHSKTYKPQD